jgi:enamine deaminase RidA (YjgF/YER057c/UK114 family)
VDLVKRALLFVVVVGFLSGVSQPLFAQEKTMEKKFVNPPTLATPRGYTHVVTATGGKTVFIAGQVAWNVKGEVVGKGDLRAQATQAYENLKAALAAAGATTADVVKMNTYIVNFKSADLPMIREVRSKFFAQENPPASTLVGVQALALEDLLIEVEAIAVVKE